MSAKALPLISSVFSVFMKLSALALSKGLARPAHADCDVMFGEPLAIGDGGVLEATRSLETMCADHWRWQNKNPNGYA